MNCSCSSERCPHLQYLRTLLDNNQKRQLAAPKHADSQTPANLDYRAIWQRWKPSIMEAIRLSGCALETTAIVWAEFARACLQLCLHVLNTNCSTNLFLFFCVSLIWAMLRGALSR